MSTAPRSLADWLRTRSDAELGDLLCRRPDLLVPVPADIGALAARACIRLSVVRALERLNQFTLELVDAIVLLGDEASTAGLLALVGDAAPEPAIRRGLDVLRANALVWGGDDRLHLVGGVREIGATYPAGLGRPVAVCLERHSRPQLALIVEALGLPDGSTQHAAIAAVATAFADRAWLDALLARADAEVGSEAGEVLQALANGPPLGSVADALRPVSAASADTPVRWLLAHALLVAIDGATVELPREVGLALRGDRPLGELHSVPPEPVLTKVPASAVDAGAAAEATAVVGHVESLLEAWGAEPPGVLRASGLGVRELRRVARSLDVEESVAALVVEVAAAAGLVADTGGLGAHWQPTTAYDGWRAAAPEHRWLVLARSWLTMSRLPGLVGRRDDRDKVIAALGPDVERSLAPEIRRTALGALAEVPAGSAPEPASLGALLSWRAPRRGGRLRDLAVEWTLAEAAALGVTGRGALSAAGRALLTDDEAAAAAALAAVLPPPLDHVLLQADLTAVAPGPLEPDLARELALVADVESSGGATVFRISAASVRRALDAGRSASELHELFKSRSRTPVPQALTYLVDDVARRHGVLRVGTATAYVRCDDDALLAEVLVARKAAPLRLRRLAPTVLTAHASVENVLDVLREAGYAPVAESPDGAVVIKRTAAHRTAVRPRPPRLAGDAPVPTAAQVANSVRGLRAGDEAARAARRAPVTTSGAVYSPHSRGSDALAVLQHAALDRRPVWLRYVNAQGQASHRIVEPTSVNGGYLTAYDHRREDTLTFALHRVTGVSELLGDEAP